MKKAVDAFKKSLRIRLAFGTILFFAVVLLVKTFVPPLSDDSFPKVIRIPDGVSLREASHLLKEEGAISAPLVFKDFVILFGGQGSLQAGDYYIETPMSAFFAARQFTKGEGKLKPIRVTIPEGSNVEEVATILSEKLLEFDSETFIRLAAPKQGYLFPDTYYFHSGAAPGEIIGIMEATFKKRTDPLLSEIEHSGHSFPDVVIMASILEKEAWKSTTRQMIAGILWKRISIGMPLQVDAAFVEVNGKTTFGLTTEDLREDHPYNTYTNKGLPPGPITNPGLDSIKAAITPTASPYLYYLTDRNNVMRYATTHEEHVENKALYLR
jgi:UPF0755 protein